MYKVFRIASIILLSIIGLHTFAQHKPHNAPGNLNPILPGYFADPTIRKFGDTYYIYATTDGTGNGYGPAQVWASKDFRNWKNVVMNWPTTEVVWAPDVVQQPNGKYRYYYCEPCMVHVGESDSPLGPWHNILGKDNAVLVPDRFVYNAITLDPQLFRDDDGQEYLYFGTWGIYENFGCGVAKLNPEWKEGDGQEKFFTDKKLILNTEIKDFFEAPFVFKKDGIYYFTYSSGSCHDDTYRVQYATATHPMGPYTYKGCILKTNADGTVHGPGHHSIFQDGEDYYIVYHRHNNPHSLHGFHRQVCMDRLTFDDKGNINVIEPTHEGIDLLSAKPTGKLKKAYSLPDLAYGAKVTASSFYDERFAPENITDHNNGTLWRAGKTIWDLNNDKTHITIDLGKIQTFTQVWTEFEHPTFFYQYSIFTSTDSISWNCFADRKGNTMAGSPMIDEGKTRARYIRINIHDTQKNGHFPAIWNVRVFNAKGKQDPRLLLPNTENMDLQAVEKGYPWLHNKDVDEKLREEILKHQGIVVDINADDYAEKGACNIATIFNRTGGVFNESGKEDAKEDGKIRMEAKAGKYAFYFTGHTILRSSFPLPQAMCYNSPYTIEAWVLNTSVSALETVVSLSGARNDLATTELRNGSDRSNGLIAHNGSFENSGASTAITRGAGQWQHWVVSYDGYMEKVYLNGELLQQKNNFIMVRPQGSIVLGASADGSNPFSGYLHSLKIMARSMSAEEVKASYALPSITPKATDLSFRPTLKAERVSPEHISVLLLDEKGETLNTGLYSYEYAVAPVTKKATSTKGRYTSKTGKNTKNASNRQSASAKGLSTDSKADEETLPDNLEWSKPSDLSTIVMTVPKGRVKVYVSVLDDNQKRVCVLSQEIDAPQADYTLKEQKETLRLSNDKGEHFNDNPIENGMTVLGEAMGDFIITCRFTDIEGRQRRSTPAYNEGGLIMSDGQNSVHIGVFPAYDCGNMLTHLTRRNRPQYPNGLGWNYEPWMQLQRIGNEVHARTSTDGIHWKENPGSPIILRGYQSNVEVGLYQTTYNGNKSWVEMDSIKLYIKK